MIEGLLWTGPGLPPEPIHAGDGLVPAALLRSGTTIARWADSYDEQTPEKLRVQAPCCGRDFHLTYEYASPIGNMSLVLCTFCDLAYKNEIWRDGDGGFNIVMTVDDIPFTTTPATLTAT